MRSFSHLLPAAAAILLGGCAAAQTTTAEAPAPRPVAPTPEQVAAQAASGQTVTIHAPGGTTQVVGSAASASALSTGTTIAVPATARVNTVAPGQVAVVSDGVYDAEVYPDTYYLDLPYYDAPTVVEYESLIRAGGPPRYSITTLHAPYRYYSRPYYERPYSYHHDRYSLKRFDRHTHPYSSRLLRGPHSSYDPLGSALHRDAVLRFHRASYPRNLDGRDRNRVIIDRGGLDRDHGRRDVHRGRDAHRDRGDRGRVERRGDDRPRTGYRRDGGSRRDAGRPSRSGSSRSPK